MPETCTCMSSLCLLQFKHSIMGTLLTCLLGYSRNSLTVLYTQTHTQTHSRTWPHTALKWAECSEKVLCCKMLQLKKTKSCLRYWPSFSCYMLLQNGSYILTVSKCSTCFQLWPKWYQLQRLYSVYQGYPKEFTGFLLMLLVSASH